MVTNTPASPTSLTINTLSLFISLLSILWLREYGQFFMDNHLGIVVTGLSLAVPIIVLEWIFLKPYNNASAGLSLTKKQFKGNGHWRRVLVKLLGFYASIGFVAFIYWLFPEYRGGYYQVFFDLLSRIVMAWCVLAIPYFYLLDRCMLVPKDAYWHLGSLLLGNKHTTEINKAVQLLLSWGVKLFFLPLMFIYASNNLNQLINQDVASLFSFHGELTAQHSLNLYHFFNNFLFYIDLLFVTVGYCFTVRLFDSHIRSTEPTFLGWASAIICYQPFWGAAFGSLYISYNSGRDWSNFFWDMPLFHFSYSLLILACIVVYVWASMAFGIRFSNLTHRGILCNGPFRFTKHPAYISKNISWWLIFMPFLIAPEFDEKIRLSCLLLLQNGVYFLRARTEERHLSADSDYVKYAQYIEQYGLFAKLGQRFPLLKFKKGSLLNSKKRA